MGTTIIKGKRYYWDEHPWTVKQEKVDEMHQTDLTPEEFMGCFDYHKWWTPIMEVDPNPDHYPGNTHSFYHKEENWPNSNFHYFTSGNIKLVVFDRGRSDSEQLIRVLDCYGIHSYRGQPYKIYSLRESGRYLINTETGETRSFDFPDTRCNPPQAYLPFCERDDLEGLSYSLGGYHGSYDWSYFVESYYMFRFIANKIKPEKVLKRLFVDLFVKGTRMEFDRWDKYTHIRLNRSLNLDFVMQGGVTEQLWNSGIEYFRDIICERYISCSNPDKSNVLPHIVREFRPSFKIALRHGILEQLRDLDSLTLYRDLLVVAKKLGLDLRNPKYIAPSNIRECHDRLVDIFNRRELKRMELIRRRQEIAERERQERLVIEQAKTIEENDRQYKESHKGWLDKSWKVDDLEITPLKSVKEFAEVGIQMSNCVYSAGYYKSKTSLIVKVESGSQMLEVAQLSIPALDIIQCHGYRNTDSARHRDIIKALEKISA